MESIRQGGRVRGGRRGQGGERARMKWVGPPTFIFSIPKKSNFWDIGSKKKKKNNILYKEAVKSTGPVKNVSTSVIFPALLGLAGPFSEAHGIRKSSAEWLKCQGPGKSAIWRILSWLLREAHTGSCSFLWTEAHGSPGV